MTDVATALAVIPKPTLAELAPAVVKPTGKSFEDMPVADALEDARLCACPLELARTCEAMAEKYAGSNPHVSDFYAQQARRARIWSARGNETTDGMADFVDKKKKKRTRRRK